MQTLTQSEMSRVITVEKGEHAQCKSTSTNCELNGVAYHQSPLIDKWQSMLYV